MIYIGISILIGIISIGIAFFVRYKLEENKIVKKLELKQTRKIQNIYQDFSKEIQKYENQYKEIKEQKQKEIDNLLEHYKSETIRYENNFIKENMNYNERIKEIQEKRTQAEFELKILEEKKEHISEVLNTYYDSEKQRIEDKIQNVISNCAAEMMQQVGEKANECEQEILKFQTTLESYQKRQAAVNEAIMRERQLQEQSEFYTINLSQSEIDDLLMIKELSPRFNNRELLNKIVYESYVKRPLQEMIKRVLGGRSPSGIYKIIRKSTGEIYIGRAVSVDKRWTEHVKMAFSIGSIAHSTLHTLMEKEGVWNFTFELLEEVPKDQLNEREKYYIDFYDSKNFGLNQKAGG